MYSVCECWCVCVCVRAGIYVAVRSDEQKKATATKQLRDDGNK